MASLRAVGSITASSAELRARTLAQWSAENRLTEIRVRREFPAVGRRNFPCPQGDLNLMCVENVYTTANPNFRRIEMQVYDATAASRVPMATWKAAGWPGCWALPWSRTTMWCVE